ncbi:MAG: hypothetical protein H7837_06515 [Magnetococcus sp. MYC-9]
MEKKKKYTLDEIQEWVSFLAKNSGQTPEAMTGMRTLVDALRHFEHMTDNDIDFDHPLGQTRMGGEWFHQATHH